MQIIFKLIKLTKGQSPRVWKYRFDWLVRWFLLHINLCKLFNAKSIFMQIIVLFQTIQFCMSTQFNCQKRYYFKLFILFKQFYFS